MAAKYMILENSCGRILLVLGLLALVFTVSSGTSTSEFSILPNSNTPCPMRPCYTLSQVMDNPSNYFTSNTTVVFPPGYHEVSTAGQLTIQNVNNISLVGDNYNSTMIKCVGEFGLAFSNITNLTVSKLHFSMCGAPMSNASQLVTNLFNETYDPFTVIAPAPIPSAFSIYLLHITNFTATNFGMYHSKRIGLLGVDLFGVSSIQQAVFVNNAPNCAIVFLDSYSPMETPVLNITDSSFMFGKMSDLDHLHTQNDVAAGLSIVAVQTMYYVKSYMRNVAACDNIGLAYANMLFRVNCKVTIELTRINCTGGRYYGLALELRESEESAFCQPFEVIARHFCISHSYFGKNVRSVSLDYFPMPYSGSLKLENITVENSNEELSISMSYGSVLIMEDVNFKHNTGSLGISTSQIKAFVEFYGSNTFTDNKVNSALTLRNCIVRFMAIPHSYRTKVGMVVQCMQKILAYTFKEV